MNLPVPTHPEQRWEWIKYQLRSKGFTFVSLGRELNVSAGAPQLVKYTPYPRLERAIAKRIGLTPAQIWPERWNADGTPCRQRPNSAEKRAVTRAPQASCPQGSVSNATAQRQMAQEG